MKKGLTFFALLFATSVTTLNAQVVEKGTNMINAGIGIGGSYNTFGGTSSPQISASFERGMWEVGGPGVITLGGYIGHKSYKTRAEGDFKWNYTTIGARAAYHFNGFNIEKLDVYGGAMLGYNIYNSNFDNFGSSGLSLTGFVGGRWMFVNNFGVYAEIGGGGYNFSVLNAGVTFKF